MRHLAQITTRRIPSDKQKWSGGKRVFALLNIDGTQLNLYESSEGGYKAKIVPTITTGPNGEHLPVTKQEYDLYAATEEQRKHLICFYGNARIAYATLGQFESDETAIDSGHQIADELVQELLTGSGYDPRQHLGYQRIIRSLDRLKVDYHKWLDD